MREIKFRAWSKKTKEMSYKIGIYSDGVAFYDNMQDHVMPLTMSNIELMQYTGLKDKNGVEIWESDIVKNNDSIWEIYYSEGAWKMALNGKRTDNDHLFLLEPEHSEVIGNIFQNPFKKDFEEHLKELHAKQYTGLDDEMPDDFEIWINGFDLKELDEMKVQYEKTTL